jgi:hypothetical protein
MRVVLIISALTAFSFNIFHFGQPKFSGDPKLFPDELKAYMQNVTDQHEETINLFLKAWQQDSIFSTSEQSDIIQLCQKLDNKNCRPYPHFVNLLKCMLAIKQTNLSAENYINWLSAMNFHLDSKKANTSLLNNLLEFSVNMFTDNSINHTASTRWRASSKEYKIVSDNGMFVDFNNTDLVCYIRVDSLTLFETSGRVDPANSEWKGTGGFVTWERGGYERNQVNARLKDYTIDLTGSDYKASDVVFTNKNYFEKPLTGTIEDKVKHINKPDDAAYPQFFSYTKSFKIDNLYKDINYEGGLSMQGAKLVGTGTVENPARLFLFRKDTLVLVASSIYFGFKADRVASERTSIVIKLRQDSIFHPDLFFMYRVDNRELTLQKNDSYSSSGPYFNSYHNVDMSFDQLSWRLDQDYMRFSAAQGTTIGNAYFESKNFFNYDKFLNLQLMDKVHPLISLRSFSIKFGSKTFPLQSYADYLNMPVANVEHMVMRMAFNGFVYFDNNTQMVTIKDRLNEYIAASVYKIDYDVIGFPSTVEAPMENAVFNLRNYDLTINGIPEIHLSDSQNVVIYPHNNKIVLKQNRNFQFDGTVAAGLLTFHGSNLFFSYDSFKINLQNVDVVDIHYLTGKLDNYGFPITDKSTSQLKNVTGEVLIDDANNKSGRVSNPQYPIFKSHETSYVYYESDQIQGGKYKSTDFYFAVDPFEMDSLDNFNASSMVYQGEFVSAGIFPKIRKEISLQPDKSLGFVHQVPADGMPVFGGKGTFFNKISLSNNGLKGDGTLNYLTSTTWSNDFNFYPDSMNTASQRFEIAQKTTQTEFPRSSSQNNYIHWEPYHNVMWSHKTNTDFTMFNDTTSLSGDLKLQPKGLSGWGRMNLRNSDLESNLFTYKSSEIFSDTSDFYLKSLRKEGFTVLTENVNSHIDYNQRKGWFKSNEEYSLVTFPENKYISYIDQFIWDMTRKTLAMGSQSSPQLPDYTKEDVEPEGPRFISTDPQQDSLSFVSPLAFYDYQDNYINATGVKFIEVADARIYPDKGLVTVQPNYLLKSIENAWVRANKITKYHKLHTATVNVASKKYYSGFADYDYVDENNDIEIIHFDDVKVDSSMQTVAKGTIKETNDFTLSPVYNYQGKVLLSANDSLLTFEGSTKINQTCENIDPEWLHFKTRIYPKDIYIPVQEESKNINLTKIYSGMFMYYDSIHVYPAFLTKRKNYSDKQMLVPSGYLHYDKSGDLFKIGSMEKINNFTLPDNYLSFNRGECKLYGEGNIDLGQNLGQVKLKNYGNFTHSIEDNKTSFDLAMGIDFYMAPEMVALMGNEIDSFPGLDAVDLLSNVNKKTMIAWVGEKRALEIQDEMNLFGSVKNLPAELYHTILLNELHLVWDDQTNSYHSVGKIGIASINGIQINKKVDGFFEMRIKRSGDMMDLYLQLDRRNYYYFGYTRGVMQTLSSNRKYVETIMNMKTSDRKSKTVKSDTPYTYLISTDRKKDNFYGRWQNIISGGEAKDEE